MALMLDVAPPERAEHLPGGIGPPLHALANHGNDRLVGFLIERRPGRGRSSSRNSCGDRLRGRGGFAPLTAKQIVCSEEALS